MTDMCFLPALGESNWRCCTRMGVPLLLEPERRGTPLYYPNGLLSYHYWRKVKLTTKWRDAPGAFVFGDSGGFSIRTQGAVIDADRVLRWQEAVCNAGCLLDVPTRNQFDQPIWEEGLDKTTHHTVKALPLYTKMREAGSPFRWWGVLHGNFGPQAREWWDRISGIYPFSDEGEGWAVRPEPSINPDTVAQLLKVLKEYKVRRAHFLATTGFKTAAVLAVLGPEAGLDFISFDSASAAISSGNRQVMARSEDGLSWVLMREKTRGANMGTTHADEWRMREYMWSCPCEICSAMRTHYGKIDAVTGQGWVTYCYVHNILAVVRTFAAQAAAVAAGNGHAMLKELLGHAAYFNVLKRFTGKLGKAVDTGASRGLLADL